MQKHTVFGDLRQGARAVYRVTTQGSAYLVGFHEQRGRRFVIVRGEPGTDREHVVVRDSDPRVGEHSMFELPIAEWPGRMFEVATMTSSTIEAVTEVHDVLSLAAVSGGFGAAGAAEAGGAGATGQPVNPWARPAGQGDPGAGAGPAPMGSGFSLPPPPGMSESPRIVPLPGRGTRPADALARGVGGASGPGDDPQRLAQQVVVGKPIAPAATPPAPTPAGPPPEEIPYPARHVGYAEGVAQLLRSIARRDRIFEDLARDRALRDRLRRALDESAALLEVIRRRDRS